MAVAWCTECSTFTVSVMLLTIPEVQGQLQSRGKFSNPVRRDMDCNSNTISYTLENTDCYTHS